MPQDYEGTERHLFMPVKNIDIKAALDAEGRIYHYCRKHKKNSFLGLVALMDSLN